jgi:putative hydrolase of the HAD superfamily
VIKALLVDWGGVLTSSPMDALAAFARREGVGIDTLADRLRRGGTLYQPFVELELGRITDEQFEERFAAGLELDPERAAGLRERLFDAMRPDTAMRNAVASVRRSGARVGLLSNSVGSGGYEPDVMEELFDVSVISREVGARKPEAEIYRIALERIDRPPEEIVFVDDLKAKLAPARELGIITVHHRNAGATVAELRKQFPDAALADVVGPTY